MFFVIVCMLLVQNYHVFAQRVADVVVPFKDNIESITLNPFTGSIIVKEKSQISSYDPESNSIEWQVLEKDLVQSSLMDNAVKIDQMMKAADNLDFDKILSKKKEEVTFIPNSPFIRITFDNADVILNSSDGKIAFNSINTGYRVMQSEYMPEEKAFLLMVVDKENYSCVYHDLSTNTQKWITKLAPNESFFKSLGSLVSSFKNGDIMSEDKVMTTPDFIFASINSELYKIQKNKGDILWKTDFKITDFFLSNNKENLITMRVAGNILSSKMALNLLDADTGKKLWKDDISTKYVTYMEDAGDKVLIAHASGFNFYNYADGKKVWKKDAKGDKIKQVIPIGSDYLYVADKEMNLIDKDGQNKWKKFIEICDDKEDEVYYLGKIDEEKVLYLTDSYANLVDYATGKKVWKKNIDFDKNRPLLYSYDEAKNTYLVYNDKKLYRIDPAIAGKDKPEPFAKLKKINDDKSMSNIELFDWGVALVGQNDVIGVTFDGETKYHNTYKEPGGGKRKMFGIGRSVLGGAAALYGVTEGMKTAGYATAGMLSQNDKAMNSAENSAQKTSAAMGLSGVLSNSALDKFEQRFNALKHNNEYAFVFAKNEDTGKSQLVKVRKTDGEEVDKIAIDGTKPVYEVDGYNDNVYYVHKNELRVYSRK